jgi:hypothetical protein
LTTSFLLQVDTPCGSGCYILIQVIQLVVHIML